MHPLDAVGHQRLVIEAVLDCGAPRWARRGGRVQTGVAALILGPLDGGGDHRLHSLLEIASAVDRPIGVGPDSLMRGVDHGERELRFPTPLSGARHHHWADGTEGRCAIQGSSARAFAWPKPDHTGVSGPKLWVRSTKLLPARMR
jgi:hypothetical protein